MPKTYYDWKSAGWDTDRDVALGKHPELVRDIYFVLATESRRVKIGVAKDLKNRLHTLQVGSAERLELLGSIKTDDPWVGEFELHEAWDCLRIRGEWFEAHPELLKFIEMERDQRWEVEIPDPEWNPERPRIPDGVDAPVGNSRKDRMARYCLARGLAK